MLKKNKKKIISQSSLPGDKDGVVKEVLKDLPVLCFLLLSLLFCLCLGASTTRSFFSPTALWLGGFSSFFCINGPISISSNRDFILREQRQLISFPLPVMNMATIHPSLCTCCYSQKHCESGLRL